jgi:hypothetical protein
MVMYAIVVAVMLSGSDAPPKVPVMVASYKTLKECRIKLLEIAKLQGYERIVSPMLSYAVVKISPTKSTTAFCVKNIQTI